MKSKEYRDGYKAFIDGTPRADNPHADESSHEAARDWDTGFGQASADHAASQHFPHMLLDAQRQEDSLRLKLLVVSWLLLFSITLNLILFEMIKK